jgi:hypothetical protein
MHTGKALGAGGTRERLHAAPALKRIETHAPDSVFDDVVESDDGESEHQHMEWLWE